MLRPFRAAAEGLADLSFFGHARRVAAALGLVLASAGSLAIAPKAAAESVSARREICSEISGVFTPIYYAPLSPSSALAGAHGAPPTPKASPGLVFRMEGLEPCRENRCRLHVLDDLGRRVIASIDLDHRDVKFCRSVKLLEGEKGATAPCRANSISVSSTLEFDGDDRDQAVERVSISIDHQYYLLEAHSVLEALLDGKQKSAAQCRHLGTIDDPGARVGAWKVTSKTGSVTTIYEMDRLRPARNFRDYDLARLFVSVPHPDPAPSPKRRVD
jgi:hypothetical protein